MHLSHRLTAGVLAGSLLLGGVSGAFAAKAKQTPGRFGFAAGQVSNLSSTGFTLTRTTKGTATTAAVTKTLPVTLATNVKVTARKGTTGALTNGEYALVIGKKSTAGIVAQRVVYSSTKFNANRQGRIAVARHTIAVLSVHRVAGTVTGFSPATGTLTSLTIQTKAGKTVTFSITSATRFAVKGQLQTAAPAFTTSNTVVVRYVRNKTTKTLVARSINIRTT
jgi:hypothetical protein